MNADSWVEQVGSCIEVSQPRKNEILIRWNRWRFLALCCGWGMSHLVRGHVRAAAALIWLGVVGPRPVEHHL